MFKCVDVALVADLRRMHFVNNEPFAAKRKLLRLSCAIKPRFKIEFWKKCCCMKNIALSDSPDFQRYEKRWAPAD